MVEIVSYLQTLTYLKKSNKEGVVRCTFQYYIWHKPIGDFFEYHVALEKLFL